MNATYCPPAGSAPHGAMTVDLEDWRCALNPRDNSYSENRKPIDESYVSRLTLVLLESLRQHDSKATFFVPGEVATAVPELIAEISRRGHEIASHAPVHLPVRMIPRDKIHTLIQNDVAHIENLTGKKPIGFRAPYFAINKHDGWLFEELSKLGFTYDSSVVPTWTPFWGIPFAPKHPYFPGLADISKAGKPGPILEIPVTVWPSWRHLPGLPIGGGLYFRMWPKRLLDAALQNNVNRGLSLVLYVHPGDFDPGKEDIANPSLRDSITQYMGTSSTTSRLHDVLRRFRFSTIEQVFSHYINSDCHE